MRRPALLILVLLLIAIGVLTSVQDEQDRPAEDVAPEPETSETSETVEPGLEARGTAPSVERELKPSRLGVMVGREQGHLPGMAATIRCRVVLEDDATESVPQAGKVKLVAWHPDNRVGDVHECEVKDGAFSVVMRPENRIGVRSMTLDGIPAVEVGVDPETKHVVTVGQEVVIRARRVRPTTLRVVSKDTGQELRGIEVVDGSKAHQHAAEHPGRYPADAVLVENASSPVEVPAPKTRDTERRFQRLFIRADGHAWQQVRIDPLAGGVQDIELPRGGSVLVRLDQAVEGQRFVRARMRQDTPFPAAMIPFDAEDEARIDSVAVGQRTLDLTDTGQTFPAPRALASIEVTVSAGEVVEAFFAATDVQTAPFSGVLELSRDWGPIREMSIRVTRVDPETRMREAAQKIELVRTSDRGSPRQTFTWNAGEVRPGTFLVTQRDIDWSDVIVVPETGKTDAVVAVPDPIGVTIRLASEDGDPLPSDLVLSWAAMGPGSEFGMGLSQARLDPKTREYRILAPAGKVRISARNFIFGLEVPFIRVSATQATHDLTVLRRLGFVIVLKDRDRVLKWIGPWFDEATKADDETVRHSGWSSNERGKLVIVSEPGRYQVRLKDIPGFEHPGDLTVDVQKGEVVELVVPLVKLR